MQILQSQVFMCLVWLLQSILRDDVKYYFANFVLTDIFPRMFAKKMEHMKVCEKLRMELFGPETTQIWIF